MGTSGQICCHACKRELDFQVGQKIFKGDECEHCYANIRCCKMCDFYDSSSYNDCREPSAPRIVEKDKANFCDYFRLAAPGSSLGEKDNLSSAADALFKK